MNQTIEWVVILLKDPIFQLMEINAGASFDTSKIGKNEWGGVIDITPENELPTHYDVEFNVDALLNQSVQWTIDFSL